MKKAAADLQAVAAVPPADIAYLTKYGPKVQQALVDSPKQWRNWMWVCFGCVLFFLPFIGLNVGRWSPRKAREDLADHQRQLEADLAKLPTPVSVA